MSWNGIFNINKPPGITSAQVVSIVRRLTGARRVGHAGTLDPLAAGVLPICVGPATRVVEYILEQPKVYRAEITLGVTTDTDDAEGRVLATRHLTDIDEPKVRAVLAEFTGRIRQRPPAYSAVKVAGRRAYELSRRGMPVEVEAREVTVYRLDLLEFEPPRLVVEAEVGRGTYVRSLARDIGERLGCGAHLSGLVRLRVGPFRLEDAVTPDTLKGLVEAGRASDILYPPDEPLLEWPAVVVGLETARRLRSGQALPHRGRLPDGLRVRAYTAAGAFLGILKFDRSQRLLRPEKILESEDAPGREER